MLLGSPAELPAVLRDLPVPTAHVFALALAIELAVGLLAVLRPSRGWLPAAALLRGLRQILGLIGPVDLLVRVGDDCNLE